MSEKPAQAPEARLIAFLTARLDEKQRYAEALLTAGPSDAGGLVSLLRQMLREVEAARAIVTRCGAVLASFGDRENGLWPDVSRRERSHARATLLDLAGAWSGHPDYDPEWKP